MQAVSTMAGQTVVVYFIFWNVPFLESLFQIWKINFPQVSIPKINTTVPKMDSLPRICDKRKKNVFRAPKPNNGAHLTLRLRFVSIMLPICLIHVIADAKVRFFRNS